MTTCTDECVKPTPGTKIQHCKVGGCHLTFSSTTVGDAHRVGKFGVDRRCLTAEELEAAGFHRNSRGVWVGEAGYFTRPRRSDGLAALDATPSSPKGCEALTDGATGRAA